MNNRPLLEQLSDCFNTIGKIFSDEIKKIESTDPYSPRLSLFKLIMMSVIHAESLCKQNKSLELLDYLPDSNFTGHMIKKVYMGRFAKDFEKIRDVRQVFCSVLGKLIEYEESRSLNE